jgi:hypothetical protein
MTSDSARETFSNQSGMATTLIELKMISKVKIGHYQPRGKQENES